MSAVVLRREYGDQWGPCLGSLYLKLFQDHKTHLLAFYAHKVDIYNLDKHKIGTFNSTDGIVAFNSIKPHGLESCWLLLLTETNNFYVISINTEENEKINFFIVNQYNLNDLMLPNTQSINTAAETKVILSQKCFIAVDEQLGRFITIHSFRGFIVVLELKPSKAELFAFAAKGTAHPDVERNPRLARLEKYKPIEDPTSFFVDYESIVDMKLVYSKEDSVWWIALITRNINLEYRLVYHKLWKPKNLIVRFHDYILLDDFPRLIIPFQQFFIYIYPTKHVLYSIPGTDLIEETQASHIFSKGNHIVNRLEENCGIHETMNVFSFIDFNTLLLITNDGKFYKLELGYNIVSGHSDEVVTKRTRSQFEESVNNTLCVKSWKITNLNYSSSILHQFHLHYNNPDFISINRYSELIGFTMDDVIKAETVLRLGDTYSVPITSIKGIPQLSFTSTDSNYSLYKFGESNYVENDSVMKNHILVGEYTVILYEPGINSDNETSRIDVLNKDMNIVSQYEFENLVSVTSLLPLINFKVYLPELNDFLDSEVTNLSKMLKNSFVVLTTSGDESDYDTVTEFYMRKRTEVLLFVHDETDGLQLKGICVLKCRIQALLQINERDLLLMGDYLSVKLGIEIYRDIEGDKTLQLKFSKHAEKRTQIANVTSVSRLSERYIIILDPHVGVYIAEVGPDCLIKGVSKLLIPLKLLTSIGIFSEDMFIVGDLLGNIFMINLIYDDSAPRAELFCKFNPNLGGIGCITCLPLPSDIADDVRVCYLGTSYGVILSININTHSATIAQLVESYKSTIISQLAADISNQDKSLTKQFKQFEKLSPTKWMNKISGCRTSLYLKATAITPIDVDGFEKEATDLVFILPLF